MEHFVMKPVVLKPDGMKHAVMKHAAGLAFALLATSACTPQRASPQSGAPSDAISSSPAFIVARGRVDVEGGPLSLGLSVDGVVDHVAVVEGAHVRRGQLLISTDPTPAHLDETLAHAHLSQARAQVALLESRLSAARMHATRLIAAAKQDAGDGQSAADAHEAATEAAAELDNARAAVQIAQAELQRAAYQVRQHELLAPVDGEVMHLTVWPGMHVSAQAGTLVTLLPSAARIVRAEVSQEFIDTIRAGQLAQIVSDDGRQTSFGAAHVLRIGPVFGQSMLQEDPTQRINERSVECVLALDGKSTLRVGQRVLVRFPASTQPATPTAERLGKPRPGML
jgi:multidrug efflux pump subunit AcrA (membrane-fusion protein)